MVLADSRSTLHPDGSDLVEVLLAQVAALGAEVHPAALEVLVLVDVHLGTRMNTSLPVALKRSPMASGEEDERRVDVGGAGPTL